MYMTTEADLSAALATAAVHLDPGGTVLVMPDCLSETYVPQFESGGEDAADGSGRAMRYMIWTHPAMPGGTSLYEDFAMLLRQPDGSVECVHERHTFGLFSRRQWRAAFERAGFSAVTEHADPLA
jgi:hypothetical protein